MNCAKGMLILAAMGFAVSGFAEDATAKNVKSEKDMGIRISVGVTPGISEGEIAGSSGAIEDDAGGQIDILFQRRHWTKNNPNFAGIWGAGLFFSSASGTESSDEFDLTTFGIMGQGGVAWKIGDKVVIEAQPYLGLGVAGVEITGFTDGSAPYVMYGAKAGLFVELAKSFELGVEAGYQGFSSTVELTYGSVSQDLTLTGDGLYASLVAAIKF